MNRDKFLAKSGRIKGTTKVEPVKIDYLNEKYELKLLHDTPTTATGLVKVMELISKFPEMPSFILRWDEKDARIDVDRYKNGKICKWPGGYDESHHSVRMADRIFEVNIIDPDTNRKIFKGILNIGLLIEEKVTFQIRSSFTGSNKIIHKKS